MVRDQRAAVWILEGVMFIRRAAIYAAALGALALMLLIASSNGAPEYDQGGNPIVRAWDGTRIYDGDKTALTDNPHGIAPADPPTGPPVLVPGPAVWKDPAEPGGERCR